MATDAESIEELGSAAVADISAFVARRLREEHLYHFIRSRDELLRPARPDDPETIRLLRSQYLRSLEKTWDGVLQILRTELPKALDQLLSNFKPEFQGSVDPSGLAHESITSLSPLPELVEIPDLSMAAGPSRSPTLALRNTAVDKEKDVKMERSIEGRDSVFDSSDDTSKKRARDPDVLMAAAPKKKAKRTSRTFVKTPGYKAPIKRSISLYQIKDEECIFGRSGYQGVYVLRCDVGRCKKKLGRDGPTIFTSHPFWERLALDHFDGEVHQIDSEPEIFRRFAVRVMDAATERNLGKKGPYDSSVGVGVGNGDGDGNGADPPLRPASPQKSDDKGKKPERPYNLYVPSRASAEPSASTSALDANETFKRSFYHANPLWHDDDKSPFTEHGRQGHAE